MIKKLFSYGIKLSIIIMRDLIDLSIDATELKACGEGKCTVKKHGTDGK
ncbi:hypothetical protein BTN50_0094 [Candidatus Enterovibrio altilux]|uniref:Uncharacterized protein n=1 Tax=Candidatus Enterovibrio altilux TaxID=1927128 RepID=A0A291B6M2_9GAMM|nr:hypothetical protein BTN50_0094 [Candidatus Enterovibrio luxaltus]